jgi:hypothetical protein
MSNSKTSDMDEFTKLLLKALGMGFVISVLIGLIETYL